MYVPPAWRGNIARHRGCRRESAAPAGTDHPERRWHWPCRLAIHEGNESPVDRDLDVQMVEQRGKPLLEVAERFEHCALPWVRVGGKRTGAKTGNYDEQNSVMITMPF